MSDDLRKLLDRATGAPGARVIRLGLDDTAADAGTGVEPGRWSFEALGGRLVELSARGASATLTTAIELVLEAQLAGEPAAWITLRHSSFYAPDVADCGVDLAALVVIRAPDPIAATRAAERLLRSGAFGLLVLDFCSGDQREIELPIAHQGRLITLAQTHHTAVVCITEKPADAPSLGSLISLRAEAVRLLERRAGSGGRPREPERGHDVKLRVLKDKRHGPGWSRTRKLRGPAGY